MQKITTKTNNMKLALLKLCREVKKIAKRSKILYIMVCDYSDFPSSLSEELSVISPYTEKEIRKIVYYAKIANDINEDKNIVVRSYCIQAIKLAQDQEISLNEAIVRVVHAP